MDQIMAFQGYSGRLRDNMEKCFSLLAPTNVVGQSLDELDVFYHQRHVFIHGRKVPFVIDGDKLFKIPKIKRETTSNSGYGLNMTWDSVESEDYEFLEDSLKSSMNELKPLVQNLLSRLLEYVREFITKGKIQIKPPPETPLNSPAPPSNILIDEIRSINISGSTGVDY